ncbi:MULTISPECIES: hypothetical protein [unclassified Chryseobacterium]|uniref:hypothetical protein n=1 Tax=unclassified Chryseobacterium TaxID=2593645 RepID=UPI00226A731F|nr:MULTISPECIES: hypothetical protein [unclassified Chryseobacterium]
MKTLILPFLLLLTLFVSCTQNAEEIEDLQQNVASYDVYVAGMENYKACYWKNNVKTSLISPDSTYASKIIVKNNDVHVFGKTKTTFNGTYYYWENNTRKDLKQYLGIPSAVEYQIFDMAIDDNDDYFVGYYDTMSPIANQRYAFCVWKNGVKTVLNTYDSIIYSSSQINIFNHQPYISSMIHDAGTIKSGYFVNNTFHEVPNITWLGNFTETSNGIHFLYAKDQQYYYRQLSNNTETAVGSAGNMNIFDGKITSETNNLYVTGTSLENLYYKNNVQTNVSIDPTYSKIKDLFVLDNNIYMIKEQLSLSGSKVYINNVESQNISNSVTYLNAFNSIFVVAN